MTAYIARYGGQSISEVRAMPVSDFYAYFHAFAEMKIREDEANHG